ncbi:MULTISPECIES: 5'/3'-nucleotidase SurE [Capnocytophaga]|uniref:5'-nucleotidase SurE n=1 Tax=Capnocytophaga canis TaxID=1848903 RepID=A0A0B7IAX4_9FLAO|nr:MULTISPECIES: 5'/3'-nucleotidase SurE [Capnocytophaga]ATA73618.1 5'/3'-nucleotidase SurE [Capnocytophaga sp. H4358]ATA75760.1 5'/3'-nucleotidase SurE [Capnocytophaga sp. H2931]RIY36661.1 5'/3'-nucleotidase SurE [Capnocytophaga canis]CEN42654.1 5'-nucleotidase SurE [Capnocytophaga canis]CEN47864.1 5'-nucleotidase SurE [Capnocytophaga canis]
MTKKPLILITNDDGITAPGIRCLIKIMNEIGDVVVVAPDSPQSGMGHAVTLNSTLYCEPIHIDDGVQKEYTCSGTPADCVKIAKYEVLKRKPDLCVSGINHGSNSSINVIYSGTMSAAVEAGIEGIPAIGFSLLDFSWDANFEEARDFVKQIAINVLKNGLPKGVVLNVNIPKLKKEAIKGIKICRQAQARWIEEFDKRTNPQGRNYYWMTGKFVNEDGGDDSDEWALANGYISVVPIQFDLTAYHVIPHLEKWKMK